MTSTLRNRVCTPPKIILDLEWECSTSELDRKITPIALRVLAALHNVSIRDRLLEDPVPAAHSDPAAIFRSSWEGLHSIGQLAGPGDRVLRLGKSPCHSLRSSLIPREGLENNLQYQRFPCSDGRLSCTAIIRALRRHGASGSNVSGVFLAYTYNISMTRALVGFLTHFHARNSPRYRRAGAALTSDLDSDHDSALHLQCLANTMSTMFTSCMARHHNVFFAM